jgi:hypothetical protein
MTHWIFEDMVFVCHDLHHRIGGRISCDNGATWIVDGMLYPRWRDTFESRTRYIDSAEYFRRCAGPPRSLIVVPEVRTR